MKDSILTRSQQIATRSIHIGVNEGWWSETYGAPALEAAELDAQSMDQLAGEAGIPSANRTLLTGPSANVDNVRAAIANGVQDVGEGGFLLITYAGHGLSVGRGGPLDEAVDQTFVLYDGLLCDDCFCELVSVARPPTRVVCVFDSCSAAEMAEVTFVPREVKTERILSREMIPESDLARLVAASCNQCRGGKMTAEVLVLAACAVWETAGEDSSQGAFTRALLDAWAHGSFVGDYELLLGRVGEEASGQQPELRTYGAGASLVNERAFAP